MARFLSGLRVAIPLTLLVTMGGGERAQAEEGFRCGTGRLVSAGDHMVDVRNKCGEPDALSRRTEKRKVKQRVVRWSAGVAEEITEEREIEILLDEWFYDLGSSRFTRFVTFENNRVLTVTTGEYGKRRS